VAPARPQSPVAVSTSTKLSKLDFSHGAGSRGSAFRRFPAPRRWQCWGPGASSRQFSRRTRRARHRASTHGRLIDLTLLESPNPSNVVRGEKGRPRIMPVKASAGRPGPPTSTKRLPHRCRPPKEANGRGRYPTGAPVLGGRHLPRCPQRARAGSRRGCRATPIGKAERKNNRYEKQCATRARPRGQQHQNPGLRTDPMAGMRHQLTRRSDSGEPENFPGQPKLNSRPVLPFAMDGQIANPAAHSYCSTALLSRNVRSSHSPQSTTPEIRSDEIHRPFSSAATFRLLSATMAAN